MKTKLALGLVGLSMACIGGPVGLRPGSNVALPKSKPAAVGAVLADLACAKRKGEGDKVRSAEDAQCALQNDSVKVAPPAKRP